MEGARVLRNAEGGATEGVQFVSRVTGKKSGGAMRKFGATGFLILLFFIAVGFFMAGSLIPVAFSEGMYAADTQYADMVESKKIVLQQALRDGDFPSDTAEILKEKGFVVGYVGADGGFVEANKAEQALAIKSGEEVISAEDFVRRMSTDTKLYAAVTEATYDRAAAYYDEAAEEVFESLGTKRNNFTQDSDFNEVLKNVMGEGNAVEINSVAMVETENEEGEKESEPQLTGDGARAKGNAGEFIAQVLEKNPAASAEESTVNTADTLKVADMVAIEQRSSLFYALVRENIDKMKARDGNESKINETMNFLTTNVESEVVDVKTGEVKKVYGSPLEAPSLVALLTGSKADREKVADYSEERVLAMIKNQMGGTGYSAVGGTVASAEDKVKGSIGRMVSGSALGDAAVLGKVEPTINQSLVENSADKYQGINAGEFLALGAVNLGRRLAQASGATGGDEAAVKEYARVSQGVLAMDAAVERETLSPFDVRSKNTFLGSIVYKFAMFQMRHPEVRNLGTFLGDFGGVISRSIAEIAPFSRLVVAEDNNMGFLTDFGECETANGIGAQATAGCTVVATFDASTLNDPFNDAGFVSFMERNTELDGSGTRKVVEGSELGQFITNSVGRKLPLGVMDGGILESLKDGGILENVPFVSDILAMVAELLGANEEEKQMASGEAYVNSAKNENWGELKYAQRYVALARVTKMLKDHSSDQTAYRGMKYFEGEENAVVAYLREAEIAKK